jgi:hypothetical protein
LSSAIGSGPAWPVWVGRGAVLADIIVKRRLPYVIKKARNGAGEITLGLYPAAKR